MDTLFLGPACKKYFNFRPENWGKNISFCDDKSWTLYFSDFPAKNIWKQLFFKTRFQSHQVFRHPLYFLWLFSFCQCWLSFLIIMFLSLFSTFLILILLSLFLSLVDCHLLSCALIRAVSDPITISMHQQLLVLHSHNWLLYNTSQYFIRWDFGGMTIQDPKMGGIDPNYEWPDYWAPTTAAGSVFPQLASLEYTLTNSKYTDPNTKYTFLYTKYTFRNTHTKIKYTNPNTKYTSWNTKYTFLNTKDQCKHQTHFP